MKRIFWLILMLVIGSLGASSYSYISVERKNVLAQSERCCHRVLVTNIDPMPPGQENDLTNNLVSSCEGPLLKPYKCPLTIDFFDAQMYRFNNILIQKWIKAAGGQADLETEQAGKQLLSGIDYWIIGKLTASKVTGKTERYLDRDINNYVGGDLEGSFTFKMQLYDPHHRQVVKEAQVSWSGRASDYQTHVTGETERNLIRELAQKELMPLNEIIHDYERMPESCVVEPEIKGEVVPKQIVQVGLKKIVDAKGRLSQSFQRILVRAEKGKILNGEIAGEYRVFRVGNGIITLVYEAPDNCNIASDTINVFNSCSINDKTLPLSSTTPDNQIATRTLNLACPDGEIEIRKDANFSVTYQNSTSTTTNIGYANIPFKINYDGKQWNFQSKGVFTQEVHIRSADLPQANMMGTTHILSLEGRLISQKSSKMKQLKVKVDVLMDMNVVGSLGNASFSKKITTEGEQSVYRQEDEWVAVTMRWMDPFLTIRTNKGAGTIDKSPSNPSANMKTAFSILFLMRDGDKKRYVWSPPSNLAKGSVVTEFTLHLSKKTK